MAWSLRVTEKTTGRWACRFGLIEFDEHDHVNDALTHIRDLAPDHRPASLYFHLLDGTVRHIADLP